MRLSQIEQDDVAIQFLDKQPIAHLATADANGRPQVLPVCFARHHQSIYIAIDKKPKRVSGRELKRLRNIRANPHISLVVDHYEDDWQRLGWVMIKGVAEILERGCEYDTAQQRLGQRYRQYRDMDLSDLPVIAIRIQQVTSWGALTA